MPDIDTSREAVVMVLRELLDRCDSAHDPECMQGCIGCPQSNARALADALERCKREEQEAETVRGIDTGSDSYQHRNGMTCSDRGKMRERFDGRRTGVPEPGSGTGDSWNTEVQIPTAGRLPSHGLVERCTMPGKLFTDDLADRFKGSGSKHYRPANGTEGEMFQALWCRMCKADAGWEDGKGCNILASSMAFPIDDPEYPSEWTFDAYGQPSCTAFDRING